MASDTSSAELEQAELDALIELALARGATDLHLVAGERPWVRIDGEVSSVADAPVLDAAQVEELVHAIVPPSKREILEKRNEVDFAHVLVGHRCRVTAFRERRGLALAFRILNADVPTLDSLGLPRDILRAVYARGGGIVLFSGRAGSGKTTTLAAVLQECCRRRTARVITIEDPVEYRLAPGVAYVSQREVGRDCESFEKGVAAALDQAPDVLAIGELRDLATVRLALDAAQSGILVLASIHAYDVRRTIARLVDAFPQDERGPARARLAACLRMIVSQALLRRAGGPGRVAAVEVAHASPSLAALLREGKDHEIETVLETNRHRGAKTLDDSLVELVHGGTVARDEALANAVRPERVRQRIGASGTTRVLTPPKG